EAYQSHAKLLEETHNQLLQSTLDAGSYNKLHGFTHLANGFAIHTTPSQAKKLKESPRVKMVQRDRGAKLMTTYTPQFLKLPQTIWANDKGRQKINNNAGEGITIGFVDSGINPFHPSFENNNDNLLINNNNNTSITTSVTCSSGFCGACEVGPRFPASSCNGKIVSARFFAAGALAQSRLNDSVDFLSPFDAAVKDGVDILTLSVEPDEPAEDTVTFLDVFEIFMLLARRAGVFVVQASGNKGPGSSTVVSFSPWSVGVSACSTDRSYPATLFLGNGQKIAGVGLSGPTFGKGILKHKLVLAKDAVYINSSLPRTPPYTEECQFAEALDPMVVAGSVVICNFSAGFYNGTSTLTSILNTAKVLGFMGFILVANPIYGDFIAEPIPFPVPGIMITKTADAKIISQYYDDQTKRTEQGSVIRYGGRASIGEGREAFFDRYKTTVSRFSSRGPDIIDSHRNPADVLKPDFVAPGQQIWAAWSPLSASDPIFEGNNFAMMSGTSMAVPHIAGIAALIKQHNPSWSPPMIASAISTTATKYDHSKVMILSEGYDLGSSYPSTPFDIGEGEYVAFLCSLPKINQGEVEAASGGSCNHPLEHPADLNLPSVTITYLVGSQVVRRNVINVGGKQETYLCAVLPPNGVTVDVSPTWFTIAPEGSQDLEINLNVTQAAKDFSFGEIVLTGSLDHIVRIPLSVLPVSMS
ncbi:Subtilisin-like protease SBT2.4, partial [Bienertia sinuspersici]